MATRQPPMPSPANIIFPRLYTALSETLAASEQISADRNRRRNVTAALCLHPAPEWYKRTGAQREKIIGAFDERFYRIVDIILAVPTAAFLKMVVCGNYQSSSAGNRRTLRLTRMIFGEARKVAKLVFGFFCQWEICKPQNSIRCHAYSTNDASDDFIA